MIISIGVIASILTFTYALYMIKETFWGNYNIEKFKRKQIHEPWLFSLPAVILMLLIPVIFFVPNVLATLLFCPQPDLYLG